MVILFKSELSVKKILCGFIIGTAAVIPLAWTASARAVHVHCDQNSWSSVITKTTGGLPADYRPGGNFELVNFLQFRDIIPENPPRSKVPNCNYEISDITSLGITFWFEGTMSWSDRISIGVLPGVQYNLDPNNPTTFTSGIEEIFNLVPHQFNTAAPGPLELRLPYVERNFPVTLFGDNNGFKITNARLNLKGNNYYVPGPMPLLGVGVAFRYTRKMRRKVTSTREFIDECGRT